MSILSLAVASVFIVKFYNIQSISIAMIISMLVSTQTHFAQWQGSPYILFPYSVGFMAAVIAAYMMWGWVRYKKLFYMVVSIMLLAISLGIYQAYLPIAVCMLYLKLVFEIMNEIPAKEALKQILLMGVCFLETGIIYIICLKVSMLLYHTEPVEAQGWGGVLSGNIAFLRNPLETVKSVYLTFLQLFVVNGVINFTMFHRLIYTILFVINGWLFLKFAKRNKERAVLVGAGMLLFPMVVMAVRLLTDKITPWSMYPAIIFVPILSIVFEKNVDIKQQYRNCIQWICIICLVYLIGESVYIAQIDYVNLQKRNMKMQTVCTRILDRIETSDLYEQGMPVVFVGSLQETYSNPLTLYEDKLKGYEAYVMDWLPYEGSGWLYAQYITNYLGIYINTPPDYADIIVDVQKLEEFKNIKPFPAMDCTYVYKGALIVKLSD